MDEATFKLQKTKLILGNGIDLHCGFKTSYSDYFDCNEQNFDNRSLFKKIEYNNYKFKNFEISNRSILSNIEDDDVSNEFTLDFEKTTIWDIFFFLESETKDNPRWCDIEDRILTSFTCSVRSDFGINNRNFDKRPSLFNFSNVPTSFEISYWGEVLNALMNDKVPEVMDYTDNIRYLYRFFHYKLAKRYDSDFEFCEFLLDELKRFENKFGQYINHVFESNGQAQNKQRDFISEFPIDISSIDTFNFHAPALNDQNIKIRFINGDSDKPIFGFDVPKLTYSDPRFIFTKTYRHLEQSASKSPFVPDNDFQNAFVYGHSLSKNDYNYFFPILDRLKMTDINAYNNRICFAYSVYDKDNEAAIKKDFLKSVGTLIESYADYKGLKEKSRLLDQLSVSGKIFMYEVKD